MIGGQKLSKTATMVHWVVLVAVVIVIAILVQAVMDRQFLNVSGRYVLITGCDTGFGYLLARTLSHKRRLNVIATCLTKAGMQKFQENGDGAIGRITPIQMDVTNSESIHQALAKVTQILPENTGKYFLPHIFEKQTVCYVFERARHQVIFSSVKGYPIRKL